MPPVIAGAVAFVATSAGVTLSATAASVIGYGILAAGALAAQYVLSTANRKKAAPEVSQPIRSVVRQATAPRIRCYGRVRISGFLYFYEALNDDLCMGVAFNQGRVSEYVSFLIGDQRVQAGAIASGPIDNGRLQGFGSIRIRYGSYGQAAGGLIETFFPNWTASNRTLPNTAHAEIHIRRPPDEQLANRLPNGIPQDILAVMDTSFLWDPRDETSNSDPVSNEFFHSSWVYSDNSAMVALDHLRHPDGMRIPLEWINVDTFKQEINSCAEMVDAPGNNTERRYRCSGYYRFDEPARDVQERILATCDGELFLDPQGKVAIRVGAWQEPDVVFKDDHILEIEYTPFGADLLTQVNEMRCLYTDPFQDYELVESPIVSRADLIEKAGRALSDQMSIPMCPSMGQAIRLTRRELNKLNPRSRVRLVTNAYGLMAVGERHVRVQVSDYNLDRVYRITEGPHVSEDFKTVEMQLEEVTEATYGFDDAPPDIFDVQGNLGQGGPPDQVPNIAVRQDDVRSGGSRVPIIEIEAAIPNDESLKLDGRWRKKTTTRWRDFNNRVSDYELRSPPVSDLETYEVQARWRDPRGRFGDWGNIEEIDIVVDQDTSGNLGNYQNPDLPSVGPIPAISRFYREAHLTEWANLGLVADSGTPPSQFGVGSDDAPILNTAIEEVADTRYMLVIPREMDLGIRTPIKLREGLVMTGYGSRLFKRAEFDTDAMFVQINPDTGLVDVNTRLTKPFRLEGLTIINDHPESEDWGFGGDIMDWFCDDAILQDITCRVSNVPIINNNNATKHNGRFIVWAGNRVHMRNITMKGGAGALQRNQANPLYTGMMAGGLYCNGGEDSVVERFWIESDDDCLINIPKNNGNWTGTEYPDPPNERSDLSIKRLTYAHGRVWAWTGKMATVSVQPNIRPRPNLQADINAWKLEWEAPQAAEIQDILFYDIKGSHSNNSFKIANTRSYGGIRRVTFRDCVCKMIRVYDPNDNQMEGNGNSILVEAAHIDDENGAQYDHDCPVDDIRIIDCNFLDTYRMVLEIATNHDRGPDRSFFQKFIPKNISVRGGVWHRPEMQSPVASIEGVDGGGLFGIEMSGNVQELIAIHDVPDGGNGFSIENCVIKDLGAGVMAIKLGNQRPVYGVRIERNIIKGPNADANTTVVRFDGQPSPLSFAQDCVVRDNDMSKVVAGDHIEWASESLLRNNQAYQNLGNTVDTRPYARGVREVNSQTNNYTLVVADANRTIEIDSGTAKTLTIPTNATAAIPVGSQVDVIQVGNGVITIQGAVGVDVNERLNRFKTAGKWARATLYKRQADKWSVSGDLVA